jgi:ParB family chromosome partitioning protein
MANVVAKIKEISVSSIQPNPEQPRKIFNKAALEELAASIKENGLIQPIKVRPINKVGQEGRYEIIAGERRWRAHQLAGLETIHCIVERTSELDMDIQAIIENMARVDVTPLEEARAFQRMLDKGMTMEELAKRLGRQAWRIEERVRLLDLDPQILKLYETGNVSQEAASEISRIKEHSQQMKIFKLVSGGQLKGYKAIRTAVDTALGKLSQADIFGEAAPAATEEDVEVLRGIEAKIAQITKMVSAGFKDGECVIAAKVDRDRARHVADQLAAIKVAISHMEKGLRNATAQAEIVMVA